MVVKRLAHNMCRSGEAVVVGEDIVDDAVVLGHLVRIAVDVLHQADDSDFFQLGGDSLLITRLARRVGKELGVRVPIRDIPAGRTLGNQTEIVRRLLAGTPA